MMFLKKDVVLAVVVPPGSADAPLLYFLLEQSGEPAIIVFSRTWRQFQRPNQLAAPGERPNSCFFGMIAAADLRAIAIDQGIRAYNIDLFFAGIRAWNAQYAGPACRA
jgi:hypothetical protein